MSKLNVDEDVPQMALAVIPENATGTMRAMLIDAVSAGIMIERSRQRRAQIEADLQRVIDLISDQPTNAT